MVKSVIKPISQEVDRVASQVVDAAFTVHSALGVPVIKDGIKRMAL